MSATRPTPWRLLCIVSLMLWLVCGLHVTDSPAQPKGKMTWAIHFTIAPTFFEPAETTGIYVVSVSLCHARCPGETHAGQSAGPQPGRILERERRRPDVRVQATPGGDLPQRRPAHRRGCEIQLRALPRVRAPPLFKEKVKAVEIVDPHRVRFHLKEPWPDFMTFYGTPATSAGWIVPKKYIERVGDDGFKKHPIGAGPYKFVSQKAGHRAGPGGL